MNPQIDQPVFFKSSPTESALINLSDRKIIDKVLSGDTHLFELLMRRYNRRMFRVIRSIIRDGTEAEDVIQESYILAYLNLRNFNGDSNAGSWLARIAINEALGRLRRGKAGGLAEREVDLENIGSAVPGPEHAARAHEALWLIESAIDGLPRNYRTVFILRAVEQLSIDETAEYLNIKPATVKTRLHRAKTILQKRLGSKLEDLTVDVFPFGGGQCNRVVARLYAACRRMQLSPIRV